MRLPGVLLVTLALLAGACTDGDERGPDGRPRTHGDGPGATIPPSAGDCIGTPPAPPRDLKAVLAQPGAWLRVETMQSTDHKPRRVELRRFGFRFHVLGGDRAMVDALPATVETLYALNATGYAIGEALRAGATVTVHTGAHGDPREVAYAVATIGSQTVFVGECATKTLTEPFRAVYGAESARYLDAIVGKSSTEIARLLDVPTAHARYLLSDPEFRRVGELPTDILGGRLDMGWLTVRAAAPWDGPVRICSRIDLGRGDCVTLRGEYTNKTRVRLWYDTKHPRVEIGVYDTALGRRIALLATVDVARLARDAGFESVSRGFVVRLDLAATPSLADVTADPSLGPKAASVRIAPCAVNRCTV